jgi:signal transduction histidine kinase
VRLTESPGELALEVSDDGPGFDPTTAEGGQGLQNMTDRLGAVGGQLRWESTPGQGTRLHLRVPLSGGAP